MEQAPKTSSERRPGNLERCLSALTLLACGCIVVYKFFVAWRININWDEFWYLSFVHTLLRNELTLVLQGAYTHLFTWLPVVGANEADQVVAARMVMLALWGLTGWLIWRLASHWFRGLAAAAPPFVYLSLVPVMTHGGSFRSDSMLAPLLMAATLLLSSSRRSDKDELLAGLAIGIAAAVTIKVLLFAPMLALLVVYGGLEPGNAGKRRLLPVLRSTLRVGATAAIVAVVAIAAHAAAIAGSSSTLQGAIEAESVTRFAARTATATLLESGLFPRGDIFRLYADWQPLPWLLIGLGAIASAFRRRFDVAALALALFPIVFYRNAFPYFYVAMIAPASLLAGYAVTTIGDYVASKEPRLATPLLVFLLWLGLAYQGLQPAGRLLQDNQSIQREIVAGIHEIFPEPVNYIDRCGMISSFRKVNFFMSTWGMTKYLAAEQPVMERTAELARPAFMVTNVPALFTARPDRYGLLEADRAFLQRSYSRYWGPIRVAGGTGKLSAGETGVLHVPFAGDYRIESPVPLLIDGQHRQPGDVFAVSGPVEIRPVAGFEPPEPLAVKLVLASARPPPRSEPPPQGIFSGL